ncbi:signal peptide peptidase SppA [Thermosulfurimonas dismutans]|uniref:Signal peptide peptidase SppA, 36K type n=1 Tax=Thermosulfurimonas dismutans TaxID=999894 RepID=A0A179D1K0_9BACT|nr:signal peptide peptidase SppA [Thermosulfurimonas dismutans]OAQ19944.1 signal peptide peptidase SppA, 36K type [Thermosulfurimonas dismutans]
MKKGFLYGLAFLGGVFLFFMVLGFLLSLGLQFRGPSHREAIGVVEIKGLITEADEKIKILEDFRYRKDIKALVVRIDSPGGTVGASQELYEELRRISRLKPVVVSLGSVATSGAYYAALGGTKILASPGTITGSIGVLLQIPNIEELLKKLGIKPVVLKSGKYKDLVSYYRTPSPKEKKILEETLSEVHEQFMRAVAERRKIPLEKVKELADGRIFTGEKAKKLGLIDDLGNFMEAVELAARLGDLKGRPHLVYGSGKKGLLKKLIEGQFDLPLESFWFSPWYLWDGGATLL